MLTRDDAAPWPIAEQLDLLTSDDAAPWPIAEQLAHHDDNDRRKRPAWAALLRRVFAFELEDCSCGGKMCIRSVHTTTPASIEAILRERGLWPDDDPRGPPPDFLPAQLSLL